VVWLQEIPVLLEERNISLGSMVSFLADMLAAGTISFLLLLVL